MAQMGPFRRAVAGALAALCCSGIAAGCFKSLTPTEDRSPVDPPEASDLDEPTTPPNAGPAEPDDGPAQAPPDPSPPEPSNPPPGDWRRTVAPVEPLPPPHEGLVYFEREPGYSLALDNRIVGDLDGDGYDDIVVVAVSLNPPSLQIDSLDGAAYVFYGRESLPDALSVDHADAVLRGTGFGLPAPFPQARGPGDLNGDGLADLVLGGTAGAHFIFGSEDRMSGDKDIAEFAKSWTFPSPSTDAPFPILQPVQALPAGDVQGDGLADLAITVQTGVNEMANASGVSSSPILSTYLITGRAGEWPSGSFEREWAQAEFITESPGLGGCTALGAMDVDGDGLSDLLLEAEWRTKVLVYGAPTPPTGTLVATDAGTTVALPGQTVRAMRDLNGDGSEELVWMDSFGGDQVHLAYGRGELAQPLEPDVTLSGGLRETAMAVTDFDDDGTRDLLFLVGGPTAVPPGLYLMSGRDVEGTRRLSPAQAVLVTTWETDDGDPSTISQGLALNTGGDVNGDGIDDVLATTILLTSQQQFNQLPSTRVWLLPGGSQALGE